ncbi:AAA family ATPase [Ruficoccus amylovorans]|uniref:AAA family ATPase n=1 Tax=Ruficoccus amylovorans TaxID=1804625 RepID=A0A842HF43_9BACT|nr:AAA family ATPase [Ruficoccus amylovorans]MBC2594144.1 AAA family ATPase [Ruficoccus amylovorans]
MSDKDDKNPLEELQNQIQDMIRKNPGLANMGMGVQQPGPQHVEPPPPEEKEKDEEILRRIREFSLKPKEIRDHLNRYVIKQAEAKKVLSVAICDHYNHVRQCLENSKLRDREYSKQNILLLGPTGVGKTYLMRNIARLIGVPFIKADATKFSETGYVGYDVEDLVRDLVKAANNNVELAQYGIIYIDEIDKIASAGETGGKDVSGRGVQINLLKLMEDTEVNLFAPNDIMGQMQAMMSMQRGGKKQQPQSISTRHILFIVSGAFDKLAESVKKRVEAASIGFAANHDDTDTDPYAYLKQSSSADFIKYGFEPEFIGRIPVRVACESLQSEDLAEILTSSEGSLLNQYRSDFAGYDISFNITTEAIQEVARQAHAEKTGARGLMTVLERLFRNYKFELPSTAIKSFEVTTDTLTEPEHALKELIVENLHLQDEVWKTDLARFTEAFRNTHGFTLTFEDEAAEVIITAATEADKTIRAVCEEKFKDFQHGLQIISRNTEKTEFTITAAAAKDPDKELSQWVVASFRGE